MKKLLALCASFAFSAFAFGTASASNSGTHDQPQCGGKMIVNVTYRVTNDFDSGVNGNAWANDTIYRHLRVSDLGSGMYCAAVDDTGYFVTFAGDSPGGTGTVAAGIVGVLNGGYVTTAFAGTLDPSPAYATHGNLGSFDLQCDASFNCPGARPSFLSYFSGSPSWDYASWGWTYDTARNGDWANDSSGNSGDITGTATTPPSHGGHHGPPSHGHYGHDNGPEHLR